MHQSRPYLGVAMATGKLRARDLGLILCLFLTGMTVVSSGVESKIPEKDAVRPSLECREGCVKRLDGLEMCVSQLSWTPNEGIECCVSLAFRDRSKWLLTSAVVPMTCLFWDSDLQSLERGAVCLLLDDDFAAERADLFTQVVCFEVPPRAAFFAMRIGYSKLETGKITL